MSDSRRWVIGLVFLVLLSAPAAAQYYFDYPTYKKFEICVFSGTSLPLIRGATTYDDRWNDRLLTFVHETTHIHIKSNLGLIFGGCFSFFFGPNFGIQLAADYMTASIPNTADFEFFWIWSDGRQPEENVQWKGTGRLESAPLSLNLVFRGDLGRHEWFISAGPSHYKNTFSSESFFGFGISTLTEDKSQQLVDALKIGLTIPQASWTTWGFNGGGGIHYKLSERMGLKAEIRYFFCPKKSFSWEFIKGLYDGVFFSKDYKELRNQKFPYYEDESDLVAISKNMTKLKPFNPSSVRFALGIVFSLGTTEY